MPHLASDLGLHCLPITLLGLSRLQWVNQAAQRLLLLKAFLIFPDKKGLTFHLVVNAKSFLPQKFRGISFFCYLPILICTQLNF